MSTPYSGATPVGNPPGYGQPQANYAVGPDQYGAHSGAPVAGDMGTPTTAEGRPDVEGTSVGQLMGEVAKDLSTLMRQELELAKVEVKAEATKAGKGAGLMGAAGFAGYMVLLFLSIALWWALYHLVGHSWSALIVAVLWGIVGAVAFAMGKKQLQRVNPKPERTVDTLSQVPGALKPN
ncbi:phage holin family protein [Blastococcus sp. SYSU D00813]